MGRREPLCSRHLPPSYPIYGTLFAQPDSLVYIYIYIYRCTPRLASAREGEIAKSGHRINQNTNRRIEIPIFSAAVNPFEASLPCHVILGPESPWNLFEIELGRTVGSLYIRKWRHQVMLSFDL